MSAVLRSLVVEAGLASITTAAATITAAARRGSSRIDGAAGHVRDVVHRAVHCTAVVLKWLVVEAGLASITALGSHRGTWS